MREKSFLASGRPWVWRAKKLFSRILIIKNKSMEFIIKNTNGENFVNLMRKVGYYHLPEKNSQLSFVRPLERSGYPRFHIYLNPGEKNKEINFNLHLDQKRPVYKGVSAHAGEYEGNIVEAEAERIKQILI
jgi:hypothetical protein